MMKFFDKKFTIRIHVHKPITAGVYDGLLLRWDSNATHIMLIIEIKGKPNGPPTNNL